jgi:hypothetical protein
VFLAVCPQTLDSVAGQVVALTQRLPPTGALLADFAALGACLPGLVSSADAAAGAAGARWADALGDVAAALLAHGTDLGRSAGAYRDADAGLR